VSWQNRDGWQFERRDETGASNDCVMPAAAD